MSFGWRRCAGQCVVILLAACTPRPETIAPGERPPKETAEGGLWMVMDRAEQQLATSGQLVEDDALQAYVAEIACRVAAGYCDDIRVYVVEEADFNASMAPNGMMSVWTGLLLRAENEAQLAAVLGHEIAHFEQRHTLQRWQEAQAASTGLVFFGLAAAMAGVGIAGDVATLAVAGHLQSYSRDMERDADAGGLRMMHEAGYDPAEAAKIWEGLMAEYEAGDVDGPSLFLASHPPQEERFAALSRLAEELDGGGDERRETERYLRVTLPHRGAWLEEELQRRRYARMQVVLDRLMQTGTGLAELHYFQGELHRRRGEPDDAEKALAAYDRAIGLGGTPAEAFRSRALVLWDQGETAAAHTAFEQYLAAAPAATDRAMIQAYIEELR